MRYLSRPQRTALEAIRGAKERAGAGSALDEVGKAFADLHGSSPFRSMEVYASQSAFASIDELRLIGALAAVQRGLQFHSNCEAVMLLQYCAARLSANGYLLPLSGASRLRLGGWGWLKLDPAAMAKAPPIPRRHVRLRPGTAAAKAVELLQVRKLVRTREFRLIGIGRTQLGKMCAAGHIRRLTHGIYVLPEGQAGDPIGERRALDSIGGKQTGAPVLAGECSCSAARARSSLSARQSGLLAGA